MKRISLIFLILLPFILSAENLPLEKFTELATHPRLIIRSDDIVKVRSAVQSNPYMEKLDDFVLSMAAKYLDEPTVVRKKVGKRLLATSRTVLERVLYCSYAWMVTGDERYARRAEEEMVAAAEFEDWNPSHFLDVAEMMTALALGYDWLYHTLSQSSRTKIVDAIIHHGIYGAESESQMWFYHRANNWNQVCNCGMVLGSLAIAEHEPDLALSMIEKSLKSNAIAQQVYAPDGVYPEGVGYWSYGTWFEVLLIEGLRTALGSSFGLENYSGFVKSADFVKFISTPAARSFNFSDNGIANNQCNPLLGWFALQRGDFSMLYNDFTAAERGRLRVFEKRLLPVAMFFLARCDLDKVAPPKCNFYAGQGVQPLFVYRSGWQSRNDIYLAAKGGSASLSHAHMDAGSFVYEWGGVRWSADLGSQNYHSLEKLGINLWKMDQNSDRWDVFRLGCQSHSTLTVKGRKHLVEGIATMEEVFNMPNCHGARFDLSQIFDCLDVAYRTITVDDVGKVTVLDEVAASQPTTIRWTMCSEADAKILDNGDILLQKGGKSLIVRAVTPRKCTPFVLSNTPLTNYDCENPGTCRVGFDLFVRKKCQLVVELLPLVK